MQGLRTQSSRRSTLCPFQLEAYATILATLPFDNLSVVSTVVPTPSYKATAASVGRHSKGSGRSEIARYPIQQGRNRLRPILRGYADSRASRDYPR